jgi:uncharacterized OB-fold protein
MEMKERYVNKLYGYWAEGRLMGQKCNDCGTYVLLPVPVCNNCQGTNLSWTELSKEGKLLLFSIAYFPLLRFAKYAPCAFGSVQLKDGPILWTLVEGIDLKNPVKEFARLPLDVDIEMRQMAGNYIPVCKVR